MAGWHPFGFRKLCNLPPFLNFSSIEYCFSQIEEAILHIIAEPLTLLTRSLRCVTVTRRIKVPSPGPHALSQIPSIVKAERPQLLSMLNNQGRPPLLPHLSSSRISGIRLCHGSLPNPWTERHCPPLVTKPDKCSEGDNTLSSEALRAHCLVPRGARQTLISSSQRTKSDRPSGC